MKKSISFILYNVVVVGILLALIELTLIYFLEHPHKIPEKYVSYFREYYLSSDRSIIQYEDDFAEYNNELFYTLKSGEFVFKNRAFENKFSVNSMGLRDDENSLNEPNVIVLGDSYAMGWGVDQENTFAEVIAKELNLKVLNAGISSYGTAREMALLDQLDVSNAKTLIIQYCGNDLDENKTFFANQNQLIISPKKDYQEAKNEFEETKSYFPMKHTIALGGLIFLPPQAVEEDTEIANLSEVNYLDTVSRSQSEVFLNTLLQSENIQAIPQIIITSLDTEPNSYFLQELRSTLLNSSYKSLSKKIILLDVSEVLAEDDYYLLDRHIKAKTHAYLGKLMSRLIEKEAIPTDKSFAFQSTNAFEKKKEGWSYNEGQTENGRYRMSSSTEWGPTFRFNLSKSQLNEGYETIEVNYDYFGRTDTTGLLVVSIDENGENLFWQGTDTDKSITGRLDSTGFKVSNQIKISAKLKAQLNNLAEVSVFYWNNKKQKLKLDNFSVGLRNKAPVVHRFQ